MNHRTRFLAALRNEVPDRVPVAPDISNMVPAVDSLNEFLQEGGFIALAVRLVARLLLDRPCQVD